MSQPPSDDSATEFLRTQAIRSPQPAAVPVPRPRMPPPVTGNALPVGSYLGEFELLGVIGEGGFGIVYRAWDHSLKRQVAIKEYLPSSLAWRNGGAAISMRTPKDRDAFDAGLVSFVKEAQMLAQFDHPSLVKVYRFWEANGSAYMVMPFYEGRTLRQELRERLEPVDEPTLLGWLGPIADALAVIHAEHWYHRDIAPDNVLLLAGSQRPLLLDFGAARRVIGDMTQALTVILKPGYAPVEQYAEIPGMKQGPWTDIYALGGVAHLAIRGRTPPPSLGRLVNDSYEPLATSDLAKRFSPALLAAIDHTLTVRPEKRTQTVEQLKSELGLPPPPVPSHAGEYLAGRRADPAAPETLADGFVPTQIATARHTGLAVPLPVQTILPPSIDAAVAVPEFDPTLRIAPPHADGFAPTARIAPVTPAAAQPRRPRSAAADKGDGKGLWLGLGVAVLVVAGAGGYLATRQTAATSAAPSATSVPTPTAVPATGVAQPTPTPTPPAGAAGKAAALNIDTEFDRVLASQTPGWGLEVKVDAPKLRINKDKLVFSLRSLQEGYVYVFNHGNDGQLQQLYPNGLTPPLRIAKGGTLKLPQGKIEFNVDGPAGDSRLLVLVSRWPREHKALQPREDAGFLSFPTTPDSAPIWAAASDKLPALAGRPVCPAGGACSDEFGAAAARFEVVR